MSIMPSAETLAKYGFGCGSYALADTPEADWQALFDSQGGVCGVCRRESKTRLVNDHQHVRGFKMMKPEDKRKYVRGLCCSTCNRFVLTRYADAERHRQAAEYLDIYEARKRV